MKANSGKNEAEIHRGPHEAVFYLHVALSAAGAGRVHGTRWLQEPSQLVGLCLPTRNDPCVVDGRDRLEAFRKANSSSDCANDPCRSVDNRIGHVFPGGWIQ